MAQMSVRLMAYIILISSLWYIDSGVQIKLNEVLNQWYLSSYQKPCSLNFIGIKVVYGSVWPDHSEKEILNIVDVIPLIQGCQTVTSLHTIAIKWKKIPDKSWKMTSDYFIFFVQFTHLNLFTLWLLCIILMSFGQFLLSANDVIAHAVSIWDAQSLVYSVCEIFVKECTTTMPVRTILYFQILYGQNTRLYQTWNFLVSFWPLC